ncbi:MAG TPA: hypothetical protein EYP14_14245 [Planctomycetaceae bacterium]|nr:hypothetical protein [Planctomycetaceae bacterium]
MQPNCLWCVVLAGAMVAGAVLGCGGAGSEKGASDQPKVTYYCLETHKTVELEPQEELPAVNPATGRRTLVPAYRDPKTNKWRPIPQAVDPGR